MMQGDGNNGAAPATAPQISGAEPGKTSLTSAPTSGECTTDMDCTLGAKCLRASGGTHGYCGRKVDSMGMPSMSPGRQVSGCMSSTDCPIGFRCVGDGFSKVCVR